MRRLPVVLTALSLSLCAMTPLTHASMVVVGDRGDERPVKSSDAKAPVIEAAPKSLPDAFKTIRTHSGSVPAPANAPSLTGATVIEGAYVPPPPVIPCEVTPGTLADNLDNISKSFSGKPVVWLPHFDLSISIPARIDASNYQECVSNVVAAMQSEGAPIRAVEKENVILISER